MNFSMLIVAITGTKFIFVCVYKSIPVMDDKFLTRFVSISTWMISILATLIRVVVPGKPVLNEVCITLHLDPATVDFWGIY